MRFRIMISSAALAIVPISLSSTSPAMADDPSRGMTQQAATANYGVAAAAQLVALEQSMFYLYLLSLPPDQRGGVDVETWRTRGADVMTIPSSGPIADYYTNGASVLAASTGPSDLSVAPGMPSAPAATADAGAPAPSDSVQPTTAPPETTLLDASTDLGDASSVGAALPTSGDGGGDIDADDEAIVVGSSGAGTPVGEEETADGIGALFGASVRAARHKSGAGFWFILSGIGAVGVLVTALVTRRNKRRDDRSGLD